MGQIAAGDQEHAVAAACANDGARKLAAGFRRLIPHEHGSQSKGSKNHLEEGQLDLEGMLTRFCLFDVMEKGGILTE